MYTSRYFSLFTLGAVLIILLLVRRKNAGSHTNPWLITVCLGMLLLPFGLSVLLGNVTVPRSQFALQMIAAFFPICYLAETKGKHRALCAVCIVAVILSAVLSLRLYHTDQLRNEQDTEVAESVTAELKSLDTTKPLAFIGVRRMESDSFLTEKSDVFGRSFLEWVYTPERPASATVSALRLLTACSGKQYAGISGKKLERKAADAAQDMPAYPDNGFVREEEDMIVIKLSDP